MTTCIKLISTNQHVLFTADHL